MFDGTPPDRSSTETSRCGNVHAAAGMHKYLGELSACVLSEEEKSEEAFRKSHVIETKKGGAEKLSTEVWQAGIEEKPLLYSSALL